MSTLPPSSFPGNGGDPNPIHHHTGVGDVNEIHGVYDVDKADPDEEPSPTTRGQWKDGLPGDVNVTLNEAQKRAFAALVAEQVLQCHVCSLLSAGFLQDIPKDVPAHALLSQGPRARADAHEDP